MSDNKLKKMIIFSNEKIKDICEDFIQKEVQERNMSKSAVIEEYIMLGIIRNFPNESNELRSIYRKRYKEYIHDSFEEKENVKKIRKELDL